jgi:hypothetical protein
LFAGLDALIGGTIVLDVPGFGLGRIAVSRPMEKLDGETVSDEFIAMRGMRR